MSGNTANGLPRRSAGTLYERRAPLAWPTDKEFRILSINGGGIRGIFPAAFLAELEHRYLAGSSIGDYFDLIAGTSTGGIIALGLAAGLRASHLRDLYISRGHEVFPPSNDGLLALPENWIRKACRYFRYRYDSESLKRVIELTLGKRKFGEAKVRLCIPSAEGRYSEPYIFKTPHHPDYKTDKKEYMIKVAMATAAAPTFFQPFVDGGYIFLDGGLWANDPIMVGLIDALSCFSIERTQVRILSIGCGSRPYIVDRRRISGGLLAWRKVIESAMHLQSSNALGQAGLLIGRDKITRVDPGPIGATIELDDWIGAVEKLPNEAQKSAARIGRYISVNMLYKPVDKYTAIAV